MNSVTKDYSSIVETINKGNELLKMIAAARLSIDDKTAKGDEPAAKDGLGDGIDISV